MCLSLIGLASITFVSALQRNTAQNHALETQSERGLALCALLDDLDPSKPTFNANASTASTQWAGTALYPTPMVVQANTTQGDAFNRQANVYVYNQNADASDTAMIKTVQQTRLNEIRLDVGLGSGGFLDTSGAVWVEDEPYSATNRTPGWTAGTVTGAVTSTDIPNTLNDNLYQTYREGNPIGYRLDVPNGRYSVQLYFAELDSTVNNLSKTRRMDIQLEGGTVLTEYSSRESTGAANLAESRTFDVSVTDGALDVLLSRSPDSDLDPRLAALQVRPLI